MTYNWGIHIHVLSYDKSAQMEISLIPFGLIQNWLPEAYSVGPSSSTPPRCKMNAPAYPDLTQKQPGRHHTTPAADWSRILQNPEFCCHPL